MYELFKSHGHKGSAQYAIPKANQVKSLMTREISRVVAHYRKIESEVPRTHLLVKLIEMLNVSYKRDEFSIESACSDNLRSVSALLGLVHAYNPKPHSHTGVFYNNGITELIVANGFNDVPHGWLKKNWHVANTIQIATHPFSDLDYALCNGAYPHNKPGYAVFYINVPALIIQYKYWCMSRLAKGVHVLKPGIFVSQLVIPNMLANHMDLCVVNRAFETYDGLSGSRMRRFHQISLSDHTDMVNEVCVNMKNIWSSAEPVEPAQFYSAFPNVFKDTLKDSFKIPDVVPNTNTRWALELSVLKYIDFMVKYYHKREPSKLRQVSGKIKRDIQTLETNKETQHYMVGGMNYLRSIKIHLNENF